MGQSGSTVILEVCKQAAVHHGLATLLSQPSPAMSPGKNFYFQSKVIFMSEKARIAGTDLRLLLNNLWKYFINQLIYHPIKLLIS